MRYIASLSHLTKYPIQPRGLCSLVISALCLNSGGYVTYALLPQICSRTRVGLSPLKASYGVFASFLRNARAGVRFLSQTACCIASGQRFSGMLEIRRSSVPFSEMILKICPEMDVSCTMGAALSRMVRLVLSATPFW